MSPARSKSWALVAGLAGLVLTGQASLQDSDKDFSREGKALIQGIRNLSENDRVKSEDYKQVIRETIQFGKSPDAANRFYSSQSENQQGRAQAEWHKFIDDSFSILARGEKKNPADPEWAKLREELAKLRPPPGADAKPQKEKKSQKEESGQKKNKDRGQERSSPSTPQGSSSRQTKPGQEGEQGETGSSTPSTGGEPSAKKGEADPKGSSPARARDQGAEEAERANLSNEAAHGDRKGSLAPDQARGESAGFENFGKKRNAEGTGEVAEEPAGAETLMRKVGGGTGKKEEAFGFGAPDPQSVSRLQQVKQSDSPAILHQQMQPQGQPPEPTVMGKPW